MPKHAPRRSRPIAIAAALALTVAFAAGPVRAADALQLEVFLNDAPTNLIGAFETEDGRHLSSRPAELVELGLAPSAVGTGEAPIALDAVAGLTYRYSVAEQRVYLTVAEAARRPAVVDLAAPAEPAEPAAAPGVGAVVNYDLFAAAGLPRASGATFNGASAALDARLFSPAGVLRQSGILRTDGAGAAEVLRLDTTASRSDPDWLVTGEAGDIVTGGFAWTRPVRLGGLRLRRSFDLRPDLVTAPLPSVAGSAAVPSSVDVYVNSLRTFSGAVGAGPFVLQNIPAASGPGEARVVISDATGRREERTVDIFTSPDLLKPGLTDFSVEAGVPRTGYAGPDDRYETALPAASVSLRRGVFDWLTAEAHLEASRDLVNGGVGVVVATGGGGVAGLALAASDGPEGQGLLVHGAYDTRVAGVALSASTQMRFGAYADLASLAADLFGPPGPPGRRDRRPPPGGTTDVAGAVNRVGLGADLPFDAGSLSASYVDLWSPEDDHDHFVTASYSRAIGSGHFSATAYAEIGGRAEGGVFAGLTFPLGGDVTASTALVAGSSGLGAVATASKPLGEAPGSVGWRVGGSVGAEDGQSALVSYRARAATLEAGVGRTGDGFAGTARAEGTVAVLDGGLFLANRIEDSFAVVDVGVPDVPVLHENRRVGTTDGSGRILLPNLRSNQPNRIEIDTAALPVDADVGATRAVVTPAAKAGVTVDLSVRDDGGAAVLALKTETGEPVPVGAVATLESGGTAVVGYDGRAYATGLSATDSVSVDLETGRCRGRFTYARRAGEQVVIPVVCRPEPAAEAQ